MNKVSAELIEWFQDRPVWLQEAVNKIITTGSIQESDISYLIDLCKSEVGIGEEINCINPIQGGFKEVEDDTTVFIKSIENIKNINALSPRKALDFNGANLSIIYGQNGTGKSGYTRILKHICGAKNQGVLHKNAFNNSEDSQECTIKYSLEDEEQEVNWKSEHGTHNTLSHVAIYDSDCAFEYVNNENEISYEPWVLSIFSRLIEVSTAVQQAIVTEDENLLTTLPSLPQPFNNTSIGDWYKKLSYETTIEEINEYCEWNEGFEGELNDLRVRLAETNPLEKAKSLRNQKSNLLQLETKITTLYKQLSSENCNVLMELKKESLIKRQTAIETATKVFNDFPIEGVDSETWKILWGKAREFSEKHAYPDKAFPNTDEDALCILCHQPLEDGAKKRFMSFEEYIKGSIEREATLAEKRVEETLEKFSEIPTEEYVSSQLNSSDIIAEGERKLLNDFVNMLSDRREILFSDSIKLDEIPDLPNEESLVLLKSKISSLEERARSFEEDAKGENRAEIEKRLLDLDLTRWLNNQKDAIKREVANLNYKEKLKLAKRSTSTHSLSMKKSALSESLITEAFIQRFNNEIKALGASHLNIELVKTRTRRGQVLHEIKLINPSFNVSTSEILSEGEQRVVSLAAFLADVEGRDSNNPFIFDDPISSLDLIYEEATVRRLVELSKDRQVIVFSHRISLINMLEELSKRNSITSNVIGLSRRSWGTGEPGDTSLFAKRPDKALNKLINENIAKAKKDRDTIDEETHQLIVKGICSEFRIILERLVESVLLSDIVKRFSREINTRNKIHKLINIKETDCDMFDEYMTKYSKHEHSQSIEAPVTLPTLDELETDMNIVKNWVDDFNKR
ncbi:AAA family ATPase [Gracilibacillus saliphilus]|uniref:AAA family ATPase n=1 Tax=Gracilibacillus saliphilus TaxID=543890 RepID=UPI0013CF8083|nr:hypothetical protein [Gracilibacillus saliphilus]